MDFLGWATRGCRRAACRQMVLVSMVLGSVAGPARVSLASDSPTPEPDAGLVGRRDLWFAVSAAGVVTLAAFGDRWLTEETTEANTPQEHRMAVVAEPLGNPLYVVPGLLAAYGIARFGDHPAAASGILTVGASILVAGASAAVVKEAIGRARPSQSPDDPDTVHPFSGSASFPSGHAAVAFAAATAIDRVTSARWVPWVVYPAAAMTGWSRVHDLHHWTSDVVAGAALGIWTAVKTDNFIRARSTKRHSVGFDLSPSIGGVSTAAVTYRF